MPDGRDKLKKLHSTLVSQGYDLPDYAVFEKDMEDGGKMERLRQTLVKDSYDMPDSATFRNDMWGTEPSKKKVPSILSGAISAATSGRLGGRVGGGSDVAKNVLGIGGQAKSNAQKYLGSPDIGLKDKPEIDIQDYNKRFESVTGQPSLDLGSQLPSISKTREEKKYLKYKGIEENEINPVLNDVEAGTTSGQQLSELHNNPYGKKIAEGIVGGEVPEGMNWDEVAYNINVQNRPKGVEAQNQYIYNLDNELSNSLKDIKVTNLSVSGGTGGAAASVTENTIGNVDTNSPEELGRMVETLQNATGLSKDGKIVDKDDLIKKINEKIFYLSIDKPMHPEISALGDKTKDAITRYNIARERGKKNIETNDAANQAHFELGLNFIKDANPGMYKNIIKGIEQRGIIADTDAEQLLNIGQQLYNQKLFREGAVNPEAIGKETNITYDSYQSNKANYSKVLSEELFKMGFKDVWKVPGYWIDQAAAKHPELDNKEIINDIKKAEASGGKGIVKGGAGRAFIRGLASSVKGIEGTIDALTKSPVDNYLNSKKLDLGDQMVANKRGEYSFELPSEQGKIFNDIVEGAGEFITQIGSSYLGGRLISAPYQAVSKTALTAPQKLNIAAYGGGGLSTLAQTYGGSYMDFLQKTGNPGKAKLMATFDSIGQSFLEVGILPDVKLAESAKDLFKRSSKTFAKEMMEVVEKGGGEAARRSVLNKFLRNVATVYGKEVLGEEVGQNAWNYLTEVAFSPATANSRNIGQETINIVKEATTKFAIPLILGAAGKTKSDNKLTSAAVNNAAINLDEFKEGLDRALINETISDEDYNTVLDIATTHKKNIDTAPKEDAEGNPISEDRQLEYALQTTRQEFLEKKMEGIDKIQREPIEKQIEESDKIRRKIFYGEQVKNLPKEDETIEPPVNFDNDDELLTTIKELAPESLQGQDLQFFIDQASNAPTQFLNDYGEGVTNSLLSKATTEQLKQSRDDAEALGVQEMVDLLDGIISKREQQPISDLGFDPETGKATSDAKPAEPSSISIGDEKKDVENTSETKDQEPPTTPPSEPPIAEAGGEGGKKKALANRIVEAKNVSEDVKEGVRREGLTYKPRGHKEAQSLAEAVVELEGINEAVIQAQAGKFGGDVNTLVQTTALDRLAELSEKETNPEKKLEYDKQSADIITSLDTWAREQAGRGVSALAHFYKKSPLGVVMAENTRRANEFTEWSKPKDKSWKEFFDELMKEPEFKEVVKEQLKEGRKANREARKKKVDEVFNKAKEQFKSGAAYSTIIPPKVIRAAIDGMQKAYHAGEKVVELVEEAIVFISDQIGNSWDKEKFRKEWESKLADKEGRKPLTDEEVKMKVLDRFRKKLKGLSDKDKDEVIRKAYKKLIDNGALEYQDFRQIIGEVTGRTELTPEQVAKLKELVKITNAVDEVAQKVQTERTDESLKEYRKAQDEAGKASKELQEMFGNRPDVVRRLTSIMQLNTLGIVSLVNNPIYNVWNQATVRFPVGVFNTAVDRLFIKPSEREYNVVAGQGEFWSKLGLGSKESIRQMFTGLDRMDYIQKEAQHDRIRPFKAWRDLWAKIQGKKKMSGKETADKILQGTVGVPAEVVARLLNVGDKPQRFAAEGGQAAALAKSLGLKEIDKKLFIEFPREEAYRAYKAQGLSDAQASEKADYVKDAILREGERSTFQQDNLFNDFLTRAFGVFGGKDSGTANLLKTVTVSPYIKIPSNAFWSFYNLLNPEIAMLQAMVHKGRSEYYKGKGDYLKQKMQSRESRYWLAHAFVGMASRAVVLALVQSGIFTPSSDEDDSKKERDALSLYSKGGTFKIGDIRVQGRWFGQWGMMFNSIAKKQQDMTPEQRENQDIFWSSVFGGMELEGLREAENGLLANSSSLAQAVGSGNFDRYLTNATNMFTNIIQPASVAQWNRAGIDYVPSGRGDDLLKKIDQQYAQRSPLYRAITGTKIEPKLDIWGQPIPKGGNRMSRMFGISKDEKTQFGRPIYEDALRTGDSGFLPPSVLPILNGQKLNEEQYRDLQNRVGSERMMLVAPYVNGMAEIPGFGKYSDVSDKVKKEVLISLYSEGRERGLEKFYLDYPQFAPKEKTDEEKDLDKELQRAKKEMKDD